MWNKLIAWETESRGRGVRGSAGRAIRKVFPSFHLSKFFRRGQNSGGVVNAEMGPDVPVTMPEIEVEAQYDWFTGNIPWFERHLAHLRGRPCLVLEIGCHEGRSSTWMLQNILTHPDSRLTGIDLQVQPSYWRNVRATGAEHKVTVIEKPSREALRELPFQHYDFIYVDGSHWTVDVLEDAVLSFRLAKPGAVIAFDDYLWDDPRWNQEGAPKEAVDAFLSIYKAKIELLEQCHQVWIKKLRD